MKQFLSILAFTILVGCSTPAEADHSDNGKCIDEIKHWNSIKADGEKNDSAVELRDEGTNAWASGDKATCEAKYTAAIDLIE